jgi:hypothetical protein
MSVVVIVSPRAFAGLVAHMLPPTPCAVGFDRLYHLYRCDEEVDLDFPGSGVETHSFPDAEAAKAWIRQDDAERREKQVLQ